MANPTQSLNCPNCGAPAPSADAQRCEFCGSMLTAVACPSCFGMMFAGMEYCPHCGTRADRAVTTGPGDLACPSCKSAMQRITVGATRMEECSACGGVWVPAEVFKLLCLNREHRGALVAALGVTRDNPLATTQSSGDVKVRYLPCAVCGSIMNRQNFGRLSGIVLDICRGHGVWCERGELQGALKFIENGGFELAQRAEETDAALEQAKRLAHRAGLEALSSARPRRD